MILDRADILNIYPLTPLQEGMFFHAESEPASEAYVEQWSLRIRGELRVDLVHAVWRDLVARHEVFRSLFTFGDGKHPLQIVLRDRGVEIATKDFSGKPPVEQPAALAVERTRDRARGFRLASDPLVRVLLIRLGADEWELIWSHHHIILDGWSVALVQAEFMRLYAARRAGREVALAPPQPFSRFVSSIPTTVDTAFWRAYLADGVPVAELPGVRLPRRSEIAREFVEFTPATTAKLDAFCRGEGVTLGAFIQAVWGIILGRYAYADDVVFGWVVSGRPADLPGVEGMVGLFINTLPVRVRVRADETFRELVARVHREAAELVTHQHTPLAEIQRTAGGAPLFSHVVAVENYPVADAAASAAETGFEVCSATSYDRTHYSFELVVLPSPKGLKLRLSWDRANHDDAAMIRLGGQLVHVVETLVDGPDVRPSRLNILPADQWAAVVRTPNHTAAAYPEATIVELFDAQVRANPAAPALLAPHEGDTWLTYGELERRAAAVAAHLVHDLHVPAQGRVAVCASPSVDAIVGILGILKAGATYVPIDPRYPAERVRFLLEDARPAAVLTSRADAVVLPALSVPIVEIGAHVADERALPSRATPDDVAYVIYTSGSTGKPKGCLVTHRNVVRLIANDRWEFGFGPSDTWIVAHSLSFDFSVWEMFAPLVHGARVVVPARESVQDVPAFRALLIRYRVSVLNQTPLAFANLIAAEEDAPDHALDGHLRWVIFGGDRLDVGSLRGWIRYYSADRIALVNMYGITETTVHVTQRRLSDEQILVPPRESPIGIPLPETTVYVCDRHLNPQPLGAPGEMLVGGTGVCAGYLERPELTAERFILDTFGGAGRLYRSGDLACRDASGELFYLGRNDAQVKIRGHRIEPAEIERALAALPGVKLASVIADAGPAGLELIACFVGEAAPDALRAGLARELPEYAVPSAFVVCDALPLTANGKLDRAAVRAMRAAAGSVAGAAFVAPANERERILAEIWTAVLGAARVGRHDRFIDLGGDSIKSIQIVARLRARGLTLELRDLFKYPTISELAPLVTERRPRTAVTESGAAFPLTPIQQRFFEAHPVDRAHYNHALALRCAGQCDPERLRVALQTLSDAHGALRLRFHEQTNGAWTQRVAPRGEPVAFAIVEPAREPDDTAAIERLSAAQQTALHLGDGPLFRTVLFTDPVSDLLLLVAHHLTVDGVSWRVILDDLRALLAGEELLAPTDTFEQWSAALHAPALRQRIATELPYWREQDAAPADAWQPPFAAGTYAEACEALVDWSAVETADATRACGAYHTNLGELLLAAAARSLGRWTGSGTLHVALEGHGRDAAAECDSGRTVGWFTALYPFVLDLTDAFVGLRIRALKEALRRVPSSGAGYGILRYLMPPDDAPLRAEPSVSFNYLGELSSAPGELFVLSSEPIGPAVSPRGPRPFVIEITALVSGETLRLALTYPKDIPSESVVRLSSMIREELRTIVDHCLERNAPELTPADLTHRALSLDEFDQLFDED